MQQIIAAWHKFKDEQSEQRGHGKIDWASMGQGVPLFVKKGGYLAQAINIVNNNTINMQNTINSNNTVNNQNTYNINININSAAPVPPTQPLPAPRVAPAAARSKATASTRAETSTGRNDMKKIRHKQRGGKYKQLYSEMWGAMKRGGV
jgi:hypothetical protein